MRAGPFSDGLTRSSGFNLGGACRKRHLAGIVSQADLTVQKYCMEPPDWCGRRPEMGARQPAACGESNSQEVASG